MSRLKVDIVAALLGLALGALLFAVVAEVTS